MFIKSPNRMVNIAIFFSIIASIFIFLHISVGMYVINYSRKQKKELDNKQVKLKESQDLIKDLPNPQKAIEDIEKKVAEFRDMGVTKKQVPRVIQLLGKACTDHSMNVISIKPREDIKTGNENLPAGVTKIYIELVVTSNYQLLGEFVKSISELPVYFSIEQVAIEKKQEGAEPIEQKRITERNEDKKAEATELVCDMLLSTYMIWEI